MQDAGSALMGIGEFEGENRATKAAEMAINSPLLGVDISGSTGILIYIVGDANMTMHEVNTAARIVSDAAHEAANIIFGANIDPNIKGMRVTVIATGFDSGYRPVGIPEMPSITSDEVIKQIDSRFDKVLSDETSDDDEIEDLDPTFGDDDNDFDIEKLRKQVRKDEAERAKAQNENNEEKDEPEKSLEGEKG